MSRSIAVALAFAFFTISMALWPGGLSAQEVGQTKELSPGRVRKNLGEGPANVPGFEKVRVVEDTIQPGVAYQTPSMPYPMYCTLLKGQLTGVVDGVNVVRKTGDSWVCKVGQKTETKSTGSETAVMRMHWLIAPGQK